MWSGRTQIHVLHSYLVFLSSGYFWAAFLPIGPDDVFHSVYVCDEWNWDIFFWPCFPYRWEDQYSAIQNGGWRLMVSLPLSTPFPLTRGWASFWLMSLSFTVLTMCFAALPDTSLDAFGQRRISLWCVLFHAMFVFLSVYAQAHSVFYCLFIVFLQGYCNAYACVTHIFQV